MGELVMGVTNGNGAIYCTARASATPHFKAVGGAIGRKHERGAEPLPEARAKSGGDSQKTSRDSKKVIANVLGVVIPDSLVSNSYIDELVVYLEFGLLDAAIACIEEALTMSDGVHTFKILLERVLNLKNNQIDLFNNKNGVAGQASPTPDCSQLEANNETYCNEK